MTVQCCVCKKVKEDNQWVRRAVQTPGAISHSYCPHCLELSLQAMRTELARRRTAATATA